MRFCEDVSTAHGGANDQCSAHEHEVLNDVLPLKGRRNEDDLPCLGWKKDQRCERAEHLKQQQKDGRAHKAPAQHPKPNGTFPSSEQREANRFGQKPKRERCDSARSEVLCWAKPRDELQCAEPKEHNAQPDAQQCDAVARHPARDLRVERVELSVAPT